jgi:hypothetical protein
MTWLRIRISCCTGTTSKFPSVAYRSRCQIRPFHLARSCKESDADLPVFGFLLELTLSRQGAIILSVFSKLPAPNLDDGPQTFNENCLNALVQFGYPGIQVGISLQVEAVDLSSTLVSLHKMANVKHEVTYRLLDAGKQR